MIAFELQKQQIVDTAQVLVRKGYLMATGGNLSLRIPGQDAFAITPSNYDYMKMTAGDVKTITGIGQVMGRRLWNFKGL